MKAPVIWLTGIPGSGKTTIAVQLQKYFEKNKFPSDILDGDEIRKTLSKDLGLSPEDRKEHNRRVIFVAQILSKNGVTAIVPLISPYRETRSFARTEIPNFVEVWVKASVDECIKRDPKGLYKKAQAGEIKNLTGLQAPYEEPENPELIIDTEKHSIDESIELIISTVKKLGYFN
jgi:adenylylsulfate kinase